MNKSNIISIVSVFLTVVLIGIPSAASYYPPKLVGLADQLPLESIFTFMFQLGLILLGLITGWWTRGWRQTESETDENNKSIVTEIEGCIRTDRSCWRGIAEVSEGSVVSTEIEYKAICPECQTVMFDGESDRTPSGTASVQWDCPDCANSEFDTGDKYGDAKSLFERHIREIVETDDEEHSLDNLAAEIDGEITPQDIWEKYVEAIDDPKVSMDCFV